MLDGEGVQAAFGLLVVVHFRLSNTSVHVWGLRLAVNSGAQVEPLAKNDTGVFLGKTCDFMGNAVARQRMP
jgi:hypothetical protein